MLSVNANLDIHNSKGQTVLVLLVAGCLTLGMIVSSVIMAVTNYHTTLTLARENTRFISSLMAAEIGMVLVDLEGRLREIGTLIQTLSDVRPGEKQHQWDNLIHTIRAREPYAHGVVVTDAQGRVLAWNGPEAPPDILDTDYIRAHQNGGDKMFVGAPQRSLRQSNEWSIDISLGARDYRGELTHVVAIKVALEHLLRIFDDLGMPQDTNIMITNLDGVIYLIAPDAEELIGHTFTSIAKDKEKQSGEQSETYSNVSNIRGQKMLAGRTRVRHFPLQAFAAIPMDTALASWYRHALLYGGASVAMAFIVSTMGALLVRGQLKLNRQARELALAANTDMLTGALNRRAFMVAADREFAREKRSGAPLSCVMIDLDHFKMINDTYGHTAGDLTLNSAAQFIMSRLRESDLFCRYGGEEFLLLLPDTNQDGAAVVAEELRKGLAGLRLENTNKCFFITASFGVAEKLPADTSVAEVLIRADQALYRAKNEGRNRVCRASNSLATPKGDEAAKWSADF